jgi:hypothetical protein
LKLRLTKGLTNALTLTATALCLSAAVLVASADAQTSHTPSTPIQHLIVIVGENHSYDNLFGAYQPSSGQKTQNLLYEGIIGADGSPGPNWAKAQQWQAQDTENYSITPQRRQPYASVPQPNTTFAFGQKPLVPISGFLRIFPTGHSRLPTIRPINSPIRETPPIAFSRCGNSSTRAATICSPGSE